MRFMSDVLHSSNIDVFMRGGKLPTGVMFGGGGKGGKGSKKKSKKATKAGAKAKAPGKKALLAKLRRRK